MQVKVKFLAAFAGLFLIGLQSHARVFVVSSTQDATDPRSLRGAIIAANALGGNNTIILRHGTYELNLYVYGVDEPPGYWGGLVITTGNLTIVGQANATINASGLVGRGVLDNSVFHISPNARVRLENLIVTGGSGYGGGGIANEGTLELNNCKINGNFSGGFGGGGIYNSGSLSMFNCNVSDNSGGMGFSDNGGGIYNSGDLVMNDCIVRSNSTKAGLDGDYWGGWFNVGFIPGFSGENGGDGGGIYNTGNLSVNNSTLTGNACGSGGDGSDSYNDSAGNGGNGGSGGGIYNAGLLVMNRCTVENNSSGAGGNGGNSAHDAGGSPQQDGNGGNGGNGGGVFNVAGASEAKLIRTSVHLNSAGARGEPGANGNLGLDGSGPNLFGDFTISRTTGR